MFDSVIKTESTEKYHRISLYVTYLLQLIQKQNIAFESNNILELGCNYACGSLIHTVLENRVTFVDFGFVLNKVRAACHCTPKCGNVDYIV